MFHTIAYKDSYIHIKTIAGSEHITVQTTNNKLYYVKSFHAAKLLITRLIKLDKLKLEIGV